ncbi:MAG: biosynthetic-type acetolactate synthase large subunit [Clostridiales bacterium]|jgi:acetolactate synthase-1/2/3 large subunit|nr:biosynthetic-type acetolactate synthase large subunit [Clostridiales bacterium]
MKLSGAAIIIQTLIEQGVDTVFGYPGGAVLNIYDELYKAQDKIRHYITCHEQGATHAADGYARVSGKCGVVIATSGPGATNLVTGIANAYLDSTPLVAITGNVALSLIGRDSFQEVDITGITMPITKHNYMVKDVNKLADIVREALEIAASGRPGPVLIDVPKDIQQAQTEFKPGEKVIPKRQSRLRGADFDKVVETIDKSSKPFIYVGGGAVIADATSELQEFADLIDATVGSSMMGITAMPAGHPKFLGMTGMHGKYASSMAMAKSDLIIAVGARFSDRATGNKKEFSNGKKIIHIDIDPAEINKNIPVYASLVGDVKEILRRLISAVSKCDRSAWHDEIDQIKRSPDSRLEMGKGRLNPQTVIETIRKYTSDDDVIVTDVGQHQMWTSQYYSFKKPRTFVTSGGLGAMGFGFGAAMGSCIGRGGKKTVLITSDGSFHMNMNELATAVTYNLPIMVVILNNSVLGMVRQWQTLFFGKRYSQTTLDRKTDYVKLAQAFGARGIKVEKIEELEPAIRQAYEAESPIVIEAVIDRDEKVLPMIPPGGTIKDIIVKA